MTSVKSLKLPEVPSRIRLIILVTFLVTCLMATIYLANDPDWARWHISYLGEGDAFSAHLFNVSMWVAGLMVIWLGLSVGDDLRAAKRLDPQRSNIQPWAVQTGLIVMGVCVYLIGLFPRSFGIFPHDIFGHVIYFVFLALCLASPWIVPGMRRWFYVVSYLFHAAMVGLFVAYWTGLSESLYLAEVATFVFFLAWLVLLLRQFDLSRHRQTRQVEA